MPDPREPDAIIAAARQAATVGDYAPAERLLREALQSQETDLGPHHPDLADTLNNLGVVCDLADKPDEAERCYRRAHAIAKVALAPDHPFVATSRKNLEEFCAAHGRSVDVPVPPRAARAFPRPVAIGLVSVCALVIVTIVMAAHPWLDPERSKVETGSVPVGAAGPAPRAETPPSRSAVGSLHTRAPAATATAVPTVVDVQLCRALSTHEPMWSCDQAGSVVKPGPLFFYTRVQSARDTTVVHRWYRGDRLQQEIELQVRANPQSGYRAYSRKTVTANITGDWRVELRTPDGELLHEEHFTVR
jgi:hypothetical protein